MSALMILAAETEEHLAPLIMPAWVFPLLAALFFLFAAIVSWTYRDVAHRHSDKTADAPDGHGHDAPGGH